MKFAFNTENIGFGHILNKEVAKNANVKMGSIVLFKQFDEGRNEFTGNVSEIDEIKEFVRKNG